MIARLLVAVGLLGWTAGAAADAAGAAPREPAPASAPASTASPADGELVARYRLEARIDRSRRTLEGLAVIEIENRGPTPRAAIDLWLYPNALATRPKGLDEVNFFWEYPRFFDPAAMSLESVVAADGAVAPVYPTAPGGPRTLARVTLPAPLAPGARTRLEVRFRVRLPRRFGAFGCTGEGCRLMFGWYPMVADGDGALPAAGDVEVSLLAPPGDHVLIGDTWIPPWARAHGRARATIRGATCAPLAVLAELHATTRLHRGVRLTYLTSYRPPPDSGRLPLPYVVEDYPRLALDDAADAIELLATLGEAQLPNASPGRDPRSAGARPARASPLITDVVLLEGELRREIAQAHGPLVLVSDQIYRLFPAERFRKFHTFQLARAIYASLLARRLAGAERHEDLGWAPDALASYLVDLFTVWRYRRSEFARDVLKYVSFVPAIDQIIYAPKVNFASAYFGDVAEPDGPRDDAARWNNRRPRGKLVYEKLRDLIGVSGVARVAALTVRDRRPLRAAAAEAAGRELGWFFAQWLGPYPAMNYRIRVRESVRAGARWRHRLVVVRDFAQVEEPVTVLVVDGTGARRELRWDGRGREGELVFETAGPLRVVQIDPHARLVQRYPDRPDDARFDDRDPARLKLLYNGFGALLNFSNITANVFLDFSLKRVYDLRNAVRIVAWHTDSDTIGGRVAYARYFGEQIDPNRLSSGVSLGLSAARLNPNYAATLGSQPGSRVGLGFSGFYDDRYTIVDPWRAWSLYYGLSSALTVRDDGRVLPQVTAEVEGIRLQELAPGHVLAFDVDLAATWGKLELASQLMSLGGLGGLRGYAYNEILGRAQGVARMEYRHSFIQTLTWNLGHFFYLRGFGGAAFVETGASSSCDGYAPTRQGLFADVGYSIRGFFDYLGVSQDVMNLDFAVPLRRNVPRDCNLGGFCAQPLVAGRRGYYVTISFGPAF